MSKKRQSVIFAQKLKREFKRLRQNTTPVDLKVPDEPNAVHLDNCVGTFELLQNPANEHYNLKTVCMAAGGACKFEPKKLAACVVRFSDNSLAGTTTGMMFESSKINVTGAKGFEHARMAAQEYRLFLEQIPMVMYDTSTKKLGIHTLEGRTVFRGFRLFNVVAHTHLTVKPDLKKLCKLYPERAFWKPELFPGCILRVWVKPKAQCKCALQKKNNSCPCNCTALIFDSGSVVITGTENFYDSIAASRSIKRLFNDSKSLQYQGAVLPTFLRYKDRIKYQMQDTHALQSNLEIEFVSFIENNTVNHDEKEEDKKESYNNILDNVLSVNGTSEKTKQDTVLETKDYPPFIQACLTGQIDMVQFMLSVHGRALIKTCLDDKGRNVYQCMEQELSIEQRQEQPFQVIARLLDS